MDNRMIKMEVLPKFLSLNFVTFLGNLIFELSHELVLSEFTTNLVK